MKEFKIGDDLSIKIVTDISDPLLNQEFYNNLYNNVFIDEQNNTIAGLNNMNSVSDVKNQMQRWLTTTSKYMFFLYQGRDIVGTTQAFTTGTFDALSLGYIVSPSSQGKGYGTRMLRFVSDYLTGEGEKIVLGFRDGNIASERIAAKNNYSYYLRMDVVDQNGESRPMTYYKYNGKPVMNESYTVIPNSKILTTNHWVEDQDKILSRVNPKMLTLEEYVYLTTSSNKPISLNETYFLFSSAHYGLMERLEKRKIRPQHFAITDRTAKKMFDPTIKGDINLEEFCNLVESDLRVIEVSDDKKSMILGNEVGEIKIKSLNNMMLVEDFVLTKDNEKNL